MLFFPVLPLISLKGTKCIVFLFAFPKLLTSEIQFFTDCLKDCFRKGYGYIYPQWNNNTRAMDKII